MEHSLKDLINNLFDKIAKNSDNVLDTIQSDNLVQILNNGIRNGWYDEVTECTLWAEEKLKHFFTKDNKSLIHSLLSIKIMCYFYGGQYDLLTQMCEEYLKNNNDFLTQIAALEGIAIVYQQKNELGIAYSYLCQIKDLLYSKKAKKYSEKQKYRYNLMINMAYIYHQIDDYEETFKYYDKAFEIAEKHLKANDFILLQINIITVKFNSKQISADEAIIAIDKVLQTPDLDKGTFDLASVNKTAFLLEQKDAKSAFQILQSYLPLSKHKYSPRIIHIIENYMNYLFLTKDHTNFKHIFKKYKKLLLKNDSIAIKIFESLIQIAEDEKDSAALIKYQKNLIDIQEKKLEKNLIFNLQKAKAQEQIKLKEKEIQHLKEIQSLKDKLNEELSRKNKELESFASVAAHDLKAPLRNISGFSKLIKEQLGLENTEQELFSYIEMATEQMQELIDGLLAFAKAGKFKGDAEELDLNHLMRAVQTNLQSHILQKNARIIIHKPLPILKVHRLPTLQLFQNIIANSIKFTRKDVEPFIQINYQKQTNFHHLSIKDNGIGIKQEYLSKVFQPLVRLHTSDEFEGTGLGLATCAKIVHKLNGQIYIQSEIGKGSTFNVLLPVSD